MAYLELESELFPDDERQPPGSGSVGQKEMVALEEALVDETYDEDLNLFLDVPIAEVMRSCMGTALTLLRLADQAGRPLKVLDLGAGRGATTLAFMQMAEVNEVTLVDISAELLDKAERSIRERFAGVEVNKACVDLLGQELQDFLPLDHFDLVLTTHFMQHIPVERQLGIYREAHAVLRPSGVFANVAHVKMLTPDWRNGILNQLRQWWLAAKRDPAQFEAMVGQHFTETHVHTTLPQIFSGFHDAGYRFYDCPYRRFVYAVVVAMK